MSKKQVIWLVCNNVQPPELDTHLRHQKFAKYLKEDGYEVYIIGASYLHYSKKNLIEGPEPYIYETYPDLNYIWIKVSSYSKNTGLSRMYSGFQFAHNLYKYRNELPKPDILVHNTRIPFDFHIYLTAKKLGARYITETWDLWPLGFVTSGILSERNPLMKLFYSVEHFIYKKAEKCIFTIEGGSQYIKDRGWDISSGGDIDLNKVYYINNGIDLKDFEYNKTHYILEDDDLKDKGKKKIIYLGSVSLFNNVDQIIETAKLCSDREDLVFLIFGNGTERERLISHVNELGLKNVKFKNTWVEIKYVPFIISCADINLLNYAHTGDFKYGGSQGKLFQYLAAGKPIVANIAINYDIVAKYNAGISEDIKNAHHYKKVLLSVLEDKERYEEMSCNALEASKVFDFKSLYREFKKVL